MLKVGDNAPNFILSDSTGKKVSLNNFIGKWLVLYFYPKDMTSGCTLEALDFTSLRPSFEKEGAEIIGISADSPESHAKFQEKSNLIHTLLSDEDKTTLEAYGVWQTKKLYGREFKGIIRSTFLIDPYGKIAFIWLKVKVDGHAEYVLNKLMELKK